MINPETLKELREAILTNQITFEPEIKRQRISSEEREVKVIPEVSLDLLAMRERESGMVEGWRRERAALLERLRAACLQGGDAKALRRELCDYDLTLHSQHAAYLQEMAETGVDLRDTSLLDTLIMRQVSQRK